MSEYLKLKAQAEELMRQAEEARKNEVAQVVSELKGKIEKYGITAADLGFSGFGRRVTKGAGAPAVVRYRGPNGEGWSGRGRQPVWMKEALEQGRIKEDFAV